MGRPLAVMLVRAAVERAGIDPAEVDDVVMGGSLAEGTTGANVARHIALRAGLPSSVPGTTVNRFCSTGLQTVAFAAQQIISGQNKIVVGGGLESISLVQNEHMNFYESKDPWLGEHKPDIYLNRCSRPLRSSPSATTSRGRLRTSTRWRASAAPLRLRRRGASTMRSSRSRRPSVLSTARRGRSRSKR